MSKVAPAKPPSDEERARDWLTKNAPHESAELLAPALAALLAQVRAEASQEAEAYGREYIKQTDPLLSCVNPSDEEPSCGTCRVCYMNRAEAAEAERDALREENARLRSVATEVTGKLADSEIENAALRDALTKEHGYSHGSDDPAEWDRTDCDVCALLAEPAPEKEGAK